MVLCKRKQGGEWSLPGSFALKDGVNPLIRKAFGLDAKSLEENEDLQEVEQILKTSQVFYHVSRLLCIKNYCMRASGTNWVTGSMIVTRYVQCNMFVHLCILCALEMMLNRKTWCHSPFTFAWNASMPDCFAAQCNVNANRVLQ